MEDPKRGSFPAHYDVDGAKADVAKALEKAVAASEVHQASASGTSL